MARKAVIIRGDMSAEDLAWHDFIVAEEAYDKAFEAWQPTAEDLKVKEGNALNRLLNAKFRAFDKWHFLVNNKMSVGKDEMLPVIFDAIKSNKEVFDNALIDLVGRGKQKGYLELASSVFDEIKGTGVEVREQEIERPPLCADCLLEWEA